GTTLFDATRVDFFGEREAIKLAFADSGTTVNAVATPHDAAATAQALTLTPLDVPNTVLIGQDAGLSLDVAAADVNGAITLRPDGTAEDDYYSFNAKAGQLVNIQVMSEALTRDQGKIIDSTLTVYGPDGQTVIGYYNSPQGAFNDDAFQDIDAV